MTRPRPTITISITVSPDAPRPPLSWRTSGARGVLISAEEPPEVRAAAIREVLGDL